MKTLLVINEPLLLDAMALMLGAQGHRVTLAATTEEALCVLPSLEIDLLIASLNMNPDGAEPIVEAARQKSPNLPVLLIAGSCDINDLKRVAAMRAAFWQTGTSGEGLFEGIERARGTAPTPATAT